MVAEKREAMAGKYGVEGFARPEEMLDKARPDVVIFTVSPRDLPSLVKLAADRKIHVATETPIAPTLPEADALIETARRGGIKIENFEQVWRWPREQLKRKILAAGVLGEMVQARCFTYVAPYHAMGVYLKLVGARVTRVVGYGRELRTCPAPEGERTTRNWCVGLLEFENGVSGIYEAKIRQPYLSGHDFTNCAADCTTGHIVHDALYIHRNAARPREGGVHERAGSVIHYPLQEEYREVHGRKILARVWIDTDPVIAWENPYPQYAPEPVYPGADDYGRLEEYISYHRAIVNDTEPEYTVAEARRNIETMIAVRHSAELGSRPLTLPLDPTITTRFQ
jgi:predicted dehydrogenase